MATFGSTTAFSSSSSSSVDRRVASPATPATSGIVLSIFYRCRLDATGSCRSKGLIYSDNAGSPDQLLAITDEVTFTNTTNEWIQGRFTGINNIKITSGTQYWIGFIQEDPGVPNVVRIQSTGTVNAQASDTDTYATGPTTPWGVPTLLTGPLSVYVLYTDLFGNVSWLKA